MAGPDVFGTDFNPDISTLIHVYIAWTRGERKRIGEEEQEKRRKEQEDYWWREGEGKGVRGVVVEEKVEKQK